MTTTESATELEDTYPTPVDGWTCFHCGAHFTGDFAGQRAAAEHFGAYVDAIPGCRLRMRAGERSLLRRIRWLERHYRELKERVSSEDTDKDREMARLRGEHAQTLIQAEEDGYARGIRDAGKS